jgi:NAD(P)-dependent dehydrogenase (short-subunit alcohol dehydrogenase family)
MNLEGRVACITGGAGHIGSAMGEALAELGADIAVLDMDEAPSRQVAERLRQEFARKALPIVVDLSREEQVRSVPAAILERFGRLDILINCAALVATSELPGWTVPFLEQQSETWRLALEVNLTAPFVLTQACAGLLLESGHGSVINIGSLYGVLGPDMRLYEDTPMGNVAAYSASKGGLLQLTRWLATVLAPGVRVNAITPGGLWRNQPEAFHRRFVARTPLRRMSAEEDLKGAAAYLASDLSLYVTGQNLVVDGGFTVW